MSNCHQSCVTCDAPDEGSCTSCPTTSYLAVIGGGVKGYCILCNATEEINGFRGIEGCRTCQLSPPSLICTDCADLDYMVSVNKTACVDYCGVGATADYYTRQCQCSFGYGLAHGEGTKGCIKCAVSGCDACDDNSDVCIECTIPLGLSLDKKRCLTVGGCRANCVCNASSIDAETECVSCKTSYFLQPAIPLCLHNCPVGYFEDMRTAKCELCSPGCYSCNSAATNDCTSCANGYVLRARSVDLPLVGECIAECTEMAAGNCLVCDVVIGGTRYCSKCGNGSFPLDGRCTPASTKTALICQQMVEGTCLMCDFGYFLHRGGCYSSLRDPGKQVCAAAERLNSAYYGTCRMCSTTYHRTSAGMCVKCAADGCTACSSDPDICTACSVGYYAKPQNTDSHVVTCYECSPGCAFCTSKDPQSCYMCEKGYFSFSSTYGCIRCDETNAPGGVVGAPGCKQCLSPPSRGQVICLDDNPNSSFRVPVRSKPDAADNRSLLILSITLPLIFITVVLVGVFTWMILRRRHLQPKKTPSQKIIIES